MRRYLILATASLLSIALGFYLRGAIEPIWIHDSGVYTSATHSDFPLEAFVRANRDMPELLDSVAGELGRHRFIACVVPEGFGSYRVVIPEPSRGSSLTEAQRDKLIELVGQRVRDYSIQPTP